VQYCRPELFKGCDIIFSGLDTAKAQEVELAFARLYPVFSNASAYRMDPLTPLVVPTVNLAHMSLIPAQRQHLKSEGKGFLVTNSNWYNSIPSLSIHIHTCTYALEECLTSLPSAVIGIVIPFAALQAKFGRISEVSVVTLQAFGRWLPRGFIDGHHRQHCTLYRIGRVEDRDGSLQDSGQSKS
jgi:aspartate-semialdehyde dehydrogenase